LAAKLFIHEFLQQSEFIPVVDVRSPAEFETGHIVGAQNIPLFSNEERAIIGTIYKKQGKTQAILEGLSIVGTKLADFSRKALKIAKDNKLLVYCWRGGMRSASMAWLFEKVGIETFTLDGGYKAYRNEVITSFDKINNLVVVGGYTGSGKTDILIQIKNLNQQVIDLEKIASHKGSTFGALGQAEKQPSSEHFSNLLFTELQKFDFSKPIWVEDESKRIGTIHQPDNFFEKLRDAFLIKVNLSLENRIKRLLTDYGNFEKELLIEAIERISKRLGNEFAKKAIEAIEQNDLETAIAISLHYYDKTYAFGLSKRNNENVYELDLNNLQETRWGQKTIDFYYNLKK
jgi:tRNA 2-selenouridine synthase